MNRSPRQILEDFDEAVKGQTDHDVYALLHEIIFDIQNSYELALRGCLEMNDAAQAEAIIDSVTQTVDDYITNHYGD